MPRRVGLAVVGLALLAACGGYGADDQHPSPPPSGALGPVTQVAADRALLGLCVIAAELTDDLDAASTVFFNESHDELHVIAAATEATNRGAAGALLEAKQRVEADLGGTELPAGFADDVASLLAATRGALEAIGLEASDCSPDEAA